MRLRLTGSLAAEPVSCKLARLGRAERPAIDSPSPPVRVSLSLRTAAINVVEVSSGMLVPLYGELLTTVPNRVAFT